MKKRLFVLLCVCNFMLGTSINAKDLIPLQVSFLDDERIGHGNPKSPDETPMVYIDDHTLSFEVNHPEYILNIKDEDGDVVFFTVVFPVQNQIVLTSTLSGDYEIELVVGNLLFTGWINL